MWTTNRADGSVTKITPMGGVVSSTYAIDTVAAPAPVVAQHHSAAVVSVAPTSLAASNLDFSISGGAATASPSISLGLNADPKTVTGYAVSLDPTFAGGGIMPYSAATTSVLFQLPDTPGRYTVYLEYFSSTGNRSAVISHTVS